MTDRERLIELCNEKIRTMKFQNSDHWYDFTVRTEIIADHLLANGVIVPPCKVGDIVYTIIDGEIETLKITHIRIDERKEGTSKFYDAECWNLKMPFADCHIGKSIFLTKEQAVEKLKELNNNA